MTNNTVANCMHILRQPEKTVATVAACASSAVCAVLCPQRAKVKLQDEELEREKVRERSTSASKRVQVREGKDRNHHGYCGGNPLVR